MFTCNQSGLLKSSKSLLGYLHVCLLLCCEGLELPFIGKEQKQSAATRGSCISGSAFHSSYRCHFTHTSQQKQTSPDISCIFTQTNSPEALKASHVWPLKHAHTHAHTPYKEGQKRRRQRAGGGEETHSLHQKPPPEPGHHRKNRVRADCVQGNNTTADIDLTCGTVESLDMAALEEMLLIFSGLCFDEN